jgi:hypothetical protein
LTISKQTKIIITKIGALSVSNDIIILCTKDLSDVTTKGKIYLAQYISGMYVFIGDNEEKRIIMDLEDDSFTRYFEIFTTNPDDVYSYDLPY